MKTTGEAKSILRTPAVAPPSASLEEFAGSYSSAVVLSSAQGMVVPLLSAT